MQKKPKVLYMFRNNRTEVKDSTEKLKVYGKIYEGPKDMNEIVRNSFQAVFTVSQLLKYWNLKQKRNVWNI